MNFKAFIAVWLIGGLLISLYGRAEAEPLSHSHSNDSGVVSDPKDGLPLTGKGHPVGAHKDQHGCYHSHAPLNLPVTVFLSPPTVWFQNVTETNLPFHSTIASSIAPPPRA